MPLQAPDAVMQVLIPGLQGQHLSMHIRRRSGRARVARDCRVHGVNGVAGG